MSYLICLPLDKTYKIKMYIEDRLFSEVSGETFYSVAMTEEEYSLFSDFKESLFSERKEKRVKLSNIESHRGLGRSLALGGFGGAVGGYLGKREADKLDRQGKSDEEIIEGASEKGGKIGAIAGALQNGAISAAANRSLGMGLVGAASGAVGGGLGGYLGARKNTKKRLSERRRLRE